MRNFIQIITILFIGTIYSFASTPPDSTGLLGDNFSLEGALEIFKNSDSPEDFEKLKDGVRKQHSE